MGGDGGLLYARRKRDFASMVTKWKGAQDEEALKLGRRVLLSRKERRNKSIIRTMEDEEEEEKKWPKEESKEEKIARLSAISRRGVEE